MKKLFVITQIGVLLVGCTQNNEILEHGQKPLANVTEAEATCSSSGNCNACTNCKYCKNCAKNRGSCSVCR